MASTFVSITISAYTCVEFMLVWKLTFFVIPASAAIFFKTPVTYSQYRQFKHLLAIILV